ncbi:hypothetical protein SODALDRAFT_152247 [Sodiomyces alkalinus F11]|uniref:Uncharacterized protein n=1 Tax=Sodiomyces alkalinus (strain CBS 110278 / VKM F-3762 / F11) TaxID=1314773 RepID=A0A3N2PXM9_SODAK|nr:hypothetical protein SODALDRAFT_152247 [Sodiomyces alkalinus F11]ROT39105.1 hypothetical protein SODALDRAFT_152247 [Sodiomyces alkalinus F11]
MAQIPGYYLPIVCDIYQPMLFLRLPLNSALSKPAEVSIDRKLTQRTNVCCNTEHLTCHEVVDLWQTLQTTEKETSHVAMSLGSLFSSSFLFFLGSLLPTTPSTKYSYYFRLLF